MHYSNIEPENSTYRLGGMKTILIVDDNDVFRERLAKGFSQRGYKVYSAANYDEALKVIQKQCPAMAVVDLKMVGKSRLELVRDGVQIAPDLKIVVLTGYGSIATATDAIRFGAVSYLGKPANIDEILFAFNNESNRDPADHSLIPPTLSRVEWEHIQRVPHECKGNISAAAKKLNIHRRTLQRKLNRYAPPEKN
jgi:two-component system, response regulator RegA